MTRSAFAAAAGLVAAVSAAVLPLAVAPAPALAQAGQTRITVDVPITSLAEWVRIRASLERLPDGLTAAIDAVSTGGAVITFTGSLDRAGLVAAVQRAGFRWREANPRPVVTPA
jgi:hypothetical protein